MEKIITLRNKIERLLYKAVAKPIFFLNDPEKVHDFVSGVGNILGKFKVTQGITKMFFDYKNKMLEQTILGISFKNPIGLAAGFDKNAELTQIIPSAGFGFEEVGSVTGEKCEGNSGKRLWRLPKSKSLVVYYGLKNDGCETIAKRMRKLQFSIPIGISVAKTNNEECAEEEAGIRDYVKAFCEFSHANIGDYFTINISCPNAFGGEPFTDPSKLAKLLKAIRESAPQESKPIFIKLPAELPYQTIDEIIEVSRTYKIAGFICTNLAKSRNNKNIKEQDVPNVGGMSGKVVQKLSDELVSYIYKKVDNEFVIIGCGGIFSTEDAYQKIKNGASLLQLITGMIFEGPQVISEINQGLVKLLKQDGYKNISEAVGAAVK